jgi:hypothetical protein
MSLIVCLSDEILVVVFYVVERERLNASRLG